MRPQGFTLIEILVVLAIIAALSGLAVLSLGSAGKERLKQEAALLENTLKQAQNQSIFENAAFGLTVYRNGYLLMRLDPESLQWKEEKSSRHFLPEDLILSLMLDGRAMTLTSLSEKITEAAPPALLLTPEGESTPFTITLSPADGKTPGLILSADGLGHRTLEQGMQKR